jgi:hypothetical protein
MPKCQNPECGKETPEGKDYCDENCLRKGLELKRKERKQKAIDQPIAQDQTIEAVLEHMGIEKSIFTKVVAYRHWERFVQFIKDNSGKNWHDSIRPRLRSYIGIDYRYIDAFLESCLAWGVMELTNGNLFFTGLPKEVSKDAT